MEMAMEALATRIPEDTTAAVGGCVMAEAVVPIGQVAEAVLVTLGLGLVQARVCQRDLLWQAVEEEAVALMAGEIQMVEEGVG